MRSRLPPIAPKLPGNVVMPNAPRTAVLSVVGGVGKSNPRCEVAIVVVDVGRAIVRRGNVEQAGRKVEVGLPIEFVDGLRDDVPAQGQIECQRLRHVIFILSIDTREIRSRSGIGIDKASVEGRWNAE